MHNNNPIGVFDSGVGGLSVLKQLVRFLPYERYVYLGDTARVPYGNKSDDTVKQYSKECADFLISKNVKLIVVACNTASSIALETVREIACDIPVIGMIEPAAGAALRASKSGTIGVIGTRATVNSKAYTNKIVELAGANEITVMSQPCPLFVPIVEEGLIDHPASRMIAEEYLAELKNRNIDTLVLGCTHYPLLSRLISEILNGIPLIDSGEHAAVTALRLLAERKMLVEEREEFVMTPNIDFYVTDVPTLFFEQAQLFLGFNVDSPKKIQLGVC